MNRRGFLSAFGTMAAALTLDPEKLLWRPDAKKIFIPNLIEAVPVEITPTYYGWVQTAGIANVLVGMDPAIELTPPQSKLLVESVSGKLKLGRLDCVQYIYVKQGEFIKRGSVVTWRDHCKDEIRLAGPGDIPIGVAV